MTPTIRIDAKELHAPFKRAIRALDDGDAALCWLRHKNISFVGGSVTIATDPVAPHMRLIQYEPLTIEPMRRTA